MQEEINQGTSIATDGVIIEEQYVSEYEESGIIDESNELGHTDNFLTKIPRFVIATLVFLLPIFFLPVRNLSLQSSKMLLLGLLVCTALAVWAFSRLKYGVIRFPSMKLIVAIFSIPAVFLVSTLFSPSFQTSFIGIGAETGTFVSIFILTALLLLTALTVRSTGDAFTLYVAILMAFVFAGLFQVLRLIFGFDSLTFGVFSSSVSNLAGKWNDFGVFSGLATLVSLLTLELVPLRGMFRALAYSILTAALFFVMLVNFYVVWILVAVFVLCVALYKMSLNRASLEVVDSDVAINGKVSRWKLPILSTVVLVIAVIFSVTSLLRADPVATFLTEKFNISHLEARPSWGSTLSILGSSIGENPILGTGPNRFSTQWVQHKPISINATPFWNVDFNTGIGILPTYVITAGLLGALAWLSFLFFFVMNGLKAIFFRSDNPFESYLTASAFFAAMYGWVSMIFYTPGPVPVALAFVFTGLFIAMLVQRGLVRERVVNFAASPRLSFTFSSALIIVGLTALVFGYVVATRSMAEASRIKGLISFAQGESRGFVADQLERSISVYDSDRARRDLVELRLQELNLFLNEQRDLTGEDAIARFRELLGVSIENARRAVDIDPTNYQNWISMGDVYAVVVPVGIEGAYDSSRSSYERAMQLNSTGPSILLKIARLEAMRGNADEARKRAEEALAKKANYSEVVFFLTQLEIQEGNIDAATEAAEANSLLAPNDSVVFFQLGLLYYHSNNYESAVSALERSVGLNNDYANARYFLGLSYYEVGRRGDATAQFEEIERFNQDNEEVKFILANLRAGRGPFTDAAPPISEPPEDREELPIDEE